MENKLLQRIFNTTSAITIAMCASCEAGAVARTITVSPARTSIGANFGGTFNSGDSIILHADDDSIIIDNPITIAGIDLNNKKITTGWSITATSASTIGSVTNSAFSLPLSIEGVNITLNGNDYSSLADVTLSDDIASEVDISATNAAFSNSNFYSSGAGVGIFKVLAGATGNTFRGSIIGDPANGGASFESIQVLESATFNGGIGGITATNITIGDNKTMTIDTSLNTFVGITVTGAIDGGSLALTGIGADSRNITIANNIGDNTPLKDITLSLDKFGGIGVGGGSVSFLGNITATGNIDAYNAGAGSTMSFGGNVNLTSATSRIMLGDMLQYAGGNITAGHGVNTLNGGYGAGGIECSVTSPLVITGATIVDADMTLGGDSGLRLDGGDLLLQGSIDNNGGNEIDFYQNNKLTIDSSGGARYIHGAFISKAGAAAGTLAFAGANTVKLGFSIVGDDGTGAGLGYFNLNSVTFASDDPILAPTGATKIYVPVTTYQNGKGTISLTDANTQFYAQIGVAGKSLKAIDIGGAGTLATTAGLTSIYSPFTGTGNIILAANLSLFEDVGTNIASLASLQINNRTLTLDASAARVINVPIKNDAQYNGSLITTGNSNITFYNTIGMVGATPLGSINTTANSAGTITFQNNISAQTITTGTRPVIFNGTVTTDVNGVGTITAGGNVTFGANVGAATKHLGSIDIANGSTIATTAAISIYAPITNTGSISLGGNLSLFDDVGTNIASLGALQLNNRTLTLDASAARVINVPIKNDAQYNGYVITTGNSNLVFYNTIGMVGATPLGSINTTANSAGTITFQHNISAQTITTGTRPVIFNGTVTTDVNGVGTINAGGDVTFGANVGAAIKHLGSIDIANGATLTTTSGISIYAPITNTGSISLGGNLSLFEDVGTNIASLAALQINNRTLTLDASAARVINVPIKNDAQYNGSLITTGNNNLIFYNTIGIVGATPLGSINTTANTGGTITFQNNISAQTITTGTRPVIFNGTVTTDVNGVGTITAGGNVTFGANVGAAGASLDSVSLNGLGVGTTNVYINNITTDIYANTTLFNSLTLHSNINDITLHSLTRYTLQDSALTLGNKKIIFTAGDVEFIGDIVINANYTNAGQVVLDLSGATTVDGAAITSLTFNLTNSGALTINDNDTVVMMKSPAGGLNIKVGLIPIVTSSDGNWGPSGVEGTLLYTAPPPVPPTPAPVAVVPNPDTNNTVVSIGLVPQTSSDLIIQIVNSIDPIMSSVQQASNNALDSAGLRLSFANTSSPNSPVLQVQPTSSNSTNTPIKPYIVNEGSAEITTESQKKPPLNEGDIFQKIKEESVDAIEIPAEDLQAVSVGMAAGDSPYDKFGVWGSVNAGLAQQKQLKGLAGFNSVSQGVAIGLDTMVSDNTTLGFTVSNSMNHIKHKDASAGNRTSAASCIGAFYGNHNFKNNWFIRGIALLNKTHVKHKELHTGFIAASKYNLISYGGEASIGFDHIFKNQMVLTPTTGLRILHNNKISYEETGNPRGANKISQNAMNNYSLLAGLSLAQTFVKSSISFMPAVHANLQYGIDGKSPQGSFISPITNHASTSFVGPKPSKITYNYGVSFTGSGDRIECRVSGNVSISDKYVGYQGSLKLKVKF